MKATPLPGPCLNFWNQQYLNPSEIQFWSMFASALQLTSHYCTFHDCWATNSLTMTDSSELSSRSTLQFKRFGLKTEFKTSKCTQRQQITRSKSLWSSTLQPHILSLIHFLNVCNPHPSEQTNWTLRACLNQLHAGVMVCHHTLANLRISCKEYRPHSTCRGTTTLPRVLRRFWQAGVWLGASHWWRGTTLPGFQGPSVQEPIGLQSCAARIDKSLSHNLVKALQWRQSSCLHVGDPRPSGNLWAHPLWRLKERLGGGSSARPTHCGYYIHFTLMNTDQNGTRLGLQSNLVQSQTGPMQDKSSLLALLATSAVQKQWSNTSFEYMCQAVKFHVNKLLFQLTHLKFIDCANHLDLLHVSQKLSAATSLA